MRKDSVWYGTKLPPVVKTAGEVVLAFHEGREARTRHVSLGDKYFGFRAPNFYPREGIRDMTKKEDEAFIYYLWGNPIAERKGDVLTLNNCGYETSLTSGRLHKICRSFFGLSPVPVIITAQGWLIGWHTKLNPYPLRINLKKRICLSRVDVLEQYRHLSKMRSPRKILHIYGLLRKYGPVSSEFQDKICRKVMMAKLTEVA